MAHRRPGSAIAAVDDSERGMTTRVADVESDMGDREAGDEDTPLREGSTPNRRLFSNLDGETLKHEPGTVIGSALLVAGTTVGAGILALPAFTQETGFLPSSVALGVVCLYSVAAGLLIAEVNINTMCELGSGGVSLTSMAERTLGTTGTRVASFAYLFLHYALLVAYISRGGEIVAGALGLDAFSGPLAFTIGIGSLCYFSAPRTLDKINGGLVAMVVLSFLALLTVVSGFVELEPLGKANWGALPATIPVISLAFVYQNVVPVIATSLEGSITKVRSAIVIGSAIPLVMFLAWDGAILGAYDTLTGGAGTGSDPLVALASGGETVGPLIQGFSFLAITTSYIGFVLGLTDFLADALKLTSNQKTVPYVLTLAPPFVAALLFKDIFLSALDVAGTYGVLVLFGILPPVMAWQERYSNATLSTSVVPAVPGGKPVLIGMGAFAAAIIGNQAVGSLLSAGGYN